MTDVTQLAALLDRLESDGVLLWPEGDQLRFRAPTGALTAEQRNLLGASRREVIELLRARGARPPSRTEASVGPPEMPPQAAVSTVRDEVGARLLEELSARGVTLLADGDRLKVHAPRGALDEALKQRIASSKPA